MITTEIAKTLAEILGPVIDGDAEEAVRGMREPPQPGFPEMVELAGLLSREVGESELQSFLSRNPGFILSFIPRSMGQVLSFLAQPPIGTGMKADFAVVTAGQAGVRNWLFEIERSSARIFIKDAQPGDDLRRAEKQIVDWRRYIEGNREAFAKDMLRHSLAAPLFPDVSRTGSFRLCECDTLEHCWDGFDGDSGMAEFDLIIGRWAKLSREEKRQFRFMNGDNRRWRMTTYDQVARIALLRPERNADLEPWLSFL